MLPLWQMLSGQRPGFVEHGELVVNIRVTPVTIHLADDAAEGVCSVPQPGPLGPQPRLLSGPVLNWGHAAANEQLWLSRGFGSRRVPSASAAAVDEQLEAAQEQRFAAAPWAEELMEQLVVQYSEGAVASWLSIAELPAAARALQETAFLAAAGVLTLVCIVVPLAPVGGWEKRECCWDGECVQPVWKMGGWNRWQLCLLKGAGKPVLRSHGVLSILL